MTQREINDFSRRVTAFVDTRRLRDAFSELKDMARRRMAWEVSDRLERAEQNYAYMLRYVSDGVADPDRKNVYDGIVADLYVSLDMLVRFIEKVDNASQYYSTVRLHEMHPDRNTIPQLLQQYKSLIGKTSLFSLLSGDADKAEGLRTTKLIESLQSSLFARIWVAYPLSSEDFEALGAALCDTEYSGEFLQHIISAITMGLMQQFDSKRLQLLMSAYIDCADVRVTSAALVGMLLGLWKYRNRPLPKKVADQLAAVKERPDWVSDLRITFIEMIRARDTERINRKMRDEVMPRMMDLRPDIMRKINDGELNFEDMASLQENPQWEEILDKNGITDRLKELTEIQMEGGDVMMSTFSHLKNFPFFGDIANWFLPFTASHSSLADQYKAYASLIESIAAAPFLCDSDKYSFVFALNMVPQQQREMMTSQLNAQSGNFYEAMGSLDTLTSPEMRRKAVNSYMQMIYRFYKLYSRRNEFFDPFDKGINLIAVPALADAFDDEELLQIVAEFYFKLGYWREALDVFEKLDSLHPGDAQRYQKMGYCEEKLRDLPQAIEYYGRAELLDQSIWTMKRLAACYRAVGDKDKALKYYRQLAAALPDDLSIALLLGYVLTERGDYAQAVKQFYKVEFLDEKSSKSWRPLAWTLFLSGDLAASERYYQKIILDRPTPNDYLNMGHVALAAGNMRDAINYYKLSVQSGTGDPETLMKSLSDDADSLSKAGVDLSLLPLVADAVLYSLE